MADKGIWELNDFTPKSSDYLAVSEAEDTGGKATIDQVVAAISTATIDQVVAASSTAANLDLIALRLAAAEAFSAQGLVDRWYDSLADEDGIDTGASSGVTYDASGDYYSNLQTAMHGTSDVTGWLQPAGYTLVDRSLPVPNSSTITSMWLYNVNSGAYEAYILNRTMAGTYSLVHSETGLSHGGSGWEEIPLGTPYSVPGSGDYFLGFYGNNTVSHANAGSTAVDRAYKAGTGGGAGFTEDSALYVFHGGYTRPVAATLITDGYSAEAVPSLASCLIIYSDDDGGSTVNTDIIASISRDDGTTYTAITLTDAGDYDGTYRFLRGALTDISAQPSGSTMRLKIALTAKNQRVAGFAFGT